MSKRPTIGLEAVIRPSRLAAKGEAVPAHVSHHVQATAAAAALAGPGRAGDLGGDARTVSTLLARLAEKDHQIDELRAAQNALAQELQRQADQARAERETLEATVAAADATTDELRNVIADLRADRERLQAEIIHLIDQHGCERQRLAEQHKAERDRLLMLSERSRDGGGSGGGSGGNAPTRGGTIPARSETAPAKAGWRWPFGGSDGDKPEAAGRSTVAPRMLNNRPIL
ncbi:MAG: hypothetical protein GC191_06800 [Azospirillum sp.]|nr:hypothetical protein [Azospirillum sp.]